MAQPDASARIIAGGLTVVGLSLVWVAVITIVPSQSELTAPDQPSPSRVAASVAVPPTSPVAPVASQAASKPEPELDLSIPGVPPPGQGPPPHVDPSSQQPVSQKPPEPPVLDARAAQVIKLKCDAEIEQLCPDTPDGPARARCMERRAKDLTPPCQMQVRERFVRWKEDRGRMMAACQEDARRLCASIKPGDGRMMQCLQEHAQEVSDRCYETLPKGTVIFRQ